MNEAKITQKSQPAKTISDRPKPATKGPGQDKLFYMKFHLDFIDTLRNQLCTALKLETHAELPIYFRSPYAFPAAIDLKAALEKRYNVADGSKAQKMLSKTLGRYLGSSQYINAMCSIPKRYGLDMEPADEIQDNDREFYQMKLKGRIKAAMERRKRESESGASLKISAAPNALGKSISTKPECV